MNLVFHSVINRTGATRFLLAQVLPHLTDYRLVLWWSQNNDAIDAIYLCQNASGTFTRSRLAVFVLQIFYILRRRRQISSVTINSISNLGAIIGCLFLRSGTPIDIIIHERPQGKWLISIAFLRILKSARMSTVSPFNKTELQAAGLSVTWKYPSAFDTDLAVDLPSTLDTDIVMVAHPDSTKGFDFLNDLINQLDRGLRIRLFLSRSPDHELRYPENVSVRVGRALTAQDYKAKLTILTSDPIRVKETFSYIAAESLSAGTPVFCFPSGGVSEQIIHDVNGVFADDYSVKSFKEGVEALFAHPERLNWLRAGALTINGLKSRYTQ